MNIQRSPMTAPRSMSQCRLGLFKLGRSLFRRHERWHGYGSRWQCTARRCKCPPEARWRLRPPSRLSRRRRGQGEPRRRPRRPGCVSALQDVYSATVSRSLPAAANAERPTGILARGERPPAPLGERLALRAAPWCYDRVVRVMLGRAGPGQDQAGIGALLICIVCTFLQKSFGL